MANYEQEAKQGYDLVIQEFEKRGWKYDCDPSKKHVSINFNTDDFPIEIHIFLEENGGNFLLLSHMPTKITTEKLIEAALIINDFNQYFTIGSLDLDLSDGVITYKITNSIVGCPLTAEMLDIFMSIANSIVDKYNDKFMMFNKGYVSLEDMLNLNRNK